LSRFYRGQFQFNARLAGIKVHSEMLRVAFPPAEQGSCEEVADFLGGIGAPNQATFAGQCTGPAGELGLVIVDIADEGVPGSISGDSIFINIDPACTADGQPYANSGVIRGGNIVVNGHSDAGSGVKKKD
jgi:hypothetical protein